MIGADTLLFTPRGFKKVSELKLYDKVLNMFGEFEPIIEMGPWEKVDNVVQLSTGEAILCSDDLLWDTKLVGGRSHAFLYTDELEDDKYGCPSIFELDKVKDYPVFPAYEFAVVVPTCIPDEYLLSGVATRLELFAGLIDSPICEVTKSKGVFNFYTQYIDVYIGIVKLARSLGWCVLYNNVGGVHCMTVYVMSHGDEIPIKDDYKRCYLGNTVTKLIKLLKIYKTNPKYEVLGRKIRVNGGSFLIGYSMIPVE